MALLDAAAKHHVLNAPADQLVAGPDRARAGGAGTRLVRALRTPSDVRDLARCSLDPRRGGTGVAARPAPARPRSGTRGGSRESPELHRLRALRRRLPLPGGAARAAGADRRETGVPARVQDYSRVEKPNGDQVTLNEYLEYVWAAVSKEVSPGKKATMQESKTNREADRSGNAL